MTPKATLATALAATATALIGVVAYRRHVLANAYAAMVAGEAEPQKYNDAALLIVIDIGSSSIRASCFALVDAATGRGIRTTTPLTVSDSAVEWVMLRGSMQQQPLDGIINAEGEADMRRIETTVESVVTRVLTFLRAAGLAKRVVGVGFSTFAMNLLGVDATGQVVTPVYTYAGRRPSTAAYARQLRETLVAQGALEDFHDRTGTVIHPAYAPATFLRLHHEEPATVARVAQWQSISSFLLSKWMRAGDAGPPLPMSLTEASWCGLLDFRKCQWHAPLLRLVHMDMAKMPPLQDASVSFTGLRAPFATKWPELADVPFFLGIGDGAAANVGSKCVDASRIAVTVGTSAAIRVVLTDDALRDHKVPHGLWCYRIGTNHVMLGGALNDGGSVYQFFRETLQLSAASARDTDTRLLSLAPAQHGLTLLPFLSGERAPGWRDDATCSITGITKWTQPIDFLQAGMESVALRIAHVYSLLRSYADSDALVVASGTALTSSVAWRQMQADAMGCDLAMETSATEATSRGVAVLLGSYLGLHTLADAQRLDATQLVRAQPNVAAHAVYLAARHAQETLYRNLYHQH